MNGKEVMINKMGRVTITITHNQNRYNLQIMF
jgi:hypothetical protein